MLHLNPQGQYYFYDQIVDMRKGCYGLCGLVQNEMKKNILLGDVFVFINRRCNQIKLLQWDRDGFALYEKRLERGSFQQPPAGSDADGILLSSVQLQHILQGVILQSVRYKKRFSINP